jgi:hypothetical protein
LDQILKKYARSYKNQKGGRGGRPVLGTVAMENYLHKRAWEKKHKSIGIRLRTKQCKA